MTDLVDLAIELSVACGRFARVVTQTSDSQIPRAMWRMLAHLDETGSARVSRLATLDHIAQPTATRMVARLADKGLVTTGRDPSDARAILVTISDAGRAKLRSLRHGAGEALATRLAALNERELVVLNEAAALLLRVSEPAIGAAIDIDIEEGEDA